MIVQRAGRLVAKDDLRVLRQRARNGNALLLAAGELRRKVVHAPLEPHVLQHLRRVQTVPADFRRQLHVFQCRQVLHQIVKLEHEAHVRAAIVRQLPRVQRTDFAPVQQNRALRRRVHAAEDVQKRRLARSARPDDHAQLALFHGKADVIQRANLRLPHPINLANVLKFDVCHTSTPFSIH